MRSIFNKCEKDVLVKNVFNDAYLAVKTLYDYIKGNKFNTDFSNNTALNLLILAIPVDGVSNALPAFVNLFNYLNENNLSFPQGLYGTFVLSGSDDIIIQVSSDLSGIKFNVENWSGKFYFLRKKQLVTYTAGDSGIGDTVINALLSSTNLEKGCSYLDGLANRTELDNAFLKINIDQNFYQYRDTVYKRTEFTKLWNKGFLESGLLYDLTGQTITSIDCYPMEDQIINFKGLLIELGNNQIKANFIFIETSHLNLEVKFLQTNHYPLLLLPQLIFLKNFCNVNIKAIFENSLQSGVTVAYGLGGESGYNLHLSLEGDGDGWGLTAMNQIRKTTIKNSVVSRIDFHRPFFEYLKVYDTTLGDYAFSLCGLGDIFLKNIKLMLRNQTYNTQSPRLITGRSDSGGFIDGDLFIENLSVDNDSTFLDLFLNQQETNPASTYGEIFDRPVGSPIDFRFFRHINIKNIYCNQGKGQGSITINPTKIVKDGNLLLYPYESLTIKDCNEAKLIITSDLTDLVPFYTDNEFTAKINIDNCSVHQINIFDDNVDPISNPSLNNIKFNASNVNPYIDNILEFNITGSGNYTLNGTQFHKLTFKNESDVDIVPENKVSLNLYNPYLKPRNSSPTGDFLTATLPDNVYCIVFGGKVDAGVFNQIENLFARNLKFYSTEFYVADVLYRPEANPLNLIKHEFFIENEIVASQATGHNFSANNVYEDTSTITGLFQLAKNGYVTAELTYINELNVDGIIVAQIIFEGTNDNGSSYTTYTTVQMGYINKDASSIRGNKLNFFSKVFLSRNVYEKYRAKVQLRCIVSASVTFPLSQGSSLIGGDEINLKIVYT